MAYEIRLGQIGSIAVVNPAPPEGRDDSFSLDVRRSPGGSWLEGTWTPIDAGATGTLYTVEIRAEDGFGVGSFIDAKIMSAVHMREVWREDRYWVVVAAPGEEPPEVPPGMRLFLHRRTPEAETYRGPAQKAIATFHALPEQFDFINRFFVERYVSSMQSALSDRGAVLLETKAYRDTSPTWRTDYQLEVTAGISEAGAEQVGFVWLTPVIWLLVVKAALIVILLLVSALVISRVVDMIWGPEDGGERPKPPLGIPWLGWVAIGGLGLVAYLAIKGGGPEYVRARYVEPRLAKLREGGE